MEIYKVYTIGEKLRLFREKYRLRQEQIVGNDVTRNLISQIENGKAGLTRSTAQIILSHAKEILERDNIHLDVDIEYLLEDEKTQARKILDNFIYELNQLANTNDNAFADTLNEAEKFMLKWDYTDKKIAIYDIAGDYYFKNKVFYKSSLYFENVRCLINLDMNIENLVIILKKLSNVYFYMGKYQDGVDVCTYAIDHFPQIDEVNKSMLLFNSILYYNYMENYTKALEKIKALESIVNENTKDKFGDLYNKILLLKASCLFHVNRYGESLNIYSVLISYMPRENYGNRLIYENNKAEIFILSNRIDEAKKSLNYILDNINNVPDMFPFIPQLYLEISRRHLQLADADSAIEYLYKALNYGKSYNYSFVISDILKELIHIPNKKIEVDIENEFIELVNSVKSVDPTLMIEILRYFTTSGNAKAVLEICDFCQMYTQKNKRM